MRNSKIQLSNRVWTLYLRKGRHQGEEGGGHADHHHRAGDLHQLLHQDSSIYQGTPDRPNTIQYFTHSYIHTQLLLILPLYSLLNQGFCVIFFIKWILSFFNT